MDFRSKTEARKVLQGLITRNTKGRLFSALKNPDGDAAQTLSDTEMQDLNTVAELLSPAEMARRLTGDPDRAGEFETAVGRAGRPTDFEFDQADDPNRMGTITIRLPRGVTETDIRGVGEAMSENSIAEEIYGPLTVGEFPADPQLLREGANVLESFATVRIATDDDYDEAGLFYRVAGLMLQASDR